MKLYDVLIFAVALVVLWHLSSCATRNVGDVDEPTAVSAANSAASGIQHTADRVR